MIIDQWMVVEDTALKRSYMEQVTEAFVRATLADEIIQFRAGIVRVTSVSIGHQCDIDNVQNRLVSLR